jgi:hypothetical protein
LLPGVRGLYRQHHPAGAQLLWFARSTARTNTNNSARLGGGQASVLQKALAALSADTQAAALNQLLQVRKDINQGARRRHHLLAGCSGRRSP